MPIHSPRLQSECPSQLTPRTKTFLLARNSSRTPPLLYVRSLHAFRPLSVLVISLGGLTDRLAGIFFCFLARFARFFPHFSQGHRACGSAHHELGLNRYFRNVFGASFNLIDNRL